MYKAKQQFGILMQCSNDALPFQKQFECHWTIHFLIDQVINHDVIHSITKYFDFFLVIILSGIIFSLKSLTKISFEKTYDRINFFMTKIGFRFVEKRFNEIFVLYIK